MRHRAFPSTGTGSSLVTWHLLHTLSCQGVNADSGARSPCQRVLRSACVRKAAFVISLKQSQFARVRNLRWNSNVAPSLSTPLKAFFEQRNRNPASQRKGGSVTTTLEALQDARSVTIVAWWGGDARNSRVTGDVIWDGAKPGQALALHLIYTGKILEILSTSVNSRLENQKQRYISCLALMKENYTTVYITKYHILLCNRIYRTSTRLCQNQPYKQERSPDASNQTS